MHDDDPCSYNINAPSGSKIILIFKEFNLTTPFLSYDIDVEFNCLNGEYLNIYDGDSATSNHLGSYCYPSNVPEILISSNNNFFIDFIASSFIDHGRYKIEFSFHKMGY